MVTMALDNVIRFPDSARGSLSDSYRTRTLNESRDLVAHRLREAVRPLCSALEAELLVRGDTADEREQRNFYYGGRELLRENATRLEGLLAAHWLRLLDAAAGRAEMKQPTPDSFSALDDLELLDFGDMDEQIAVKAFASRLHDGCEDGLFAAGRRLAFLAGRQENSIVVEVILADALQAALKAVGLPVQLRLEVLHGLERMAVSAFGPVIHDLNIFMARRNVLPKLRRSYSRPQADKTRAAERPAAAGDVFALLQRLVAVPSAADTTRAANAAAPGGEQGQGRSIASMAAAMEQAMTTLDTLQRTMPSAAAAPSTGVLRDFRNSSAGQGLGHLDAITVDIVATLFDFIFDDPAVADPIKALVARLQIPVLKVAMLDKSFFSSRAHPARRLLDGISRAATRCGPQVSHADPLYARVADIIERLQAEFSQDASLFDALCSDLNAFLEGQEDQADAFAVQAVPLVAERERRELAAMAADEALSAWLSTPLPSGVADLLAHEWRALLVRHYLNGDDAAWDMAITTATDLVASVTPQADSQGRKQLAAQLPTLVKSIHDGLDRLHVAVERRLSLLDCLFSIHAAVLRGAAPVVTTLWPQAAAPAAPEIVAESIETGETRLECISLVDADNVPAEATDSEAQQRVEELNRGDWVEFADGEAGPTRYRLSWVSPERGILLFTNPQSPRALSVAPAALALQIERGEAAIVPVEPIFERAVNRALETLKAA